MYFKMSHLYGVIKVKFNAFNSSIIYSFIGALCVYNGIVDSLWNGSSNLSMLKKVAQITG